MQLKFLYNFVSYCLDREELRGIPCDIATYENLKDLVISANDQLNGNEHDFKNGAVEPNSAPKRPMRPEPKSMSIALTN